jgi:hypothetical protein
MHHDDDVVRVMPSLDLVKQTDEEAISFFKIFLRLSFMHLRILIVLIALISPQSFNHPTNSTHRHISVAR